MDCANNGIPNFPKRGFSTIEAARYIGRSPSWLRKRRLRGPSDPGDPGPQWINMDSGSTLYLREDLDAWLDALAARSLVGKGRP